MISVASYPITHYLENLAYLEKVEIPEEVARKTKLFSKGTLTAYTAPSIKSFVNLEVRGWSLYHYDFGIVYPEKSKRYPLFFYQVIMAPRRAVALVYYAFPKDEEVLDKEALEPLFKRDQEYAEELLGAFKPQKFLIGDVMENHFNGIVRMSEIDHTYEQITALFALWYEGLLKQEEVPASEVEGYQQWIAGFKETFYREDYGFTSTKRYLGQKWTRDVFENYLFEK
ncbi:hypothetical protein Amet_3063 [Alkaliphilus metalliredigens QYMF]|uniref:Uncharacterized protein n=1 Tax=Alkaliphilus metalliredigens (strain QYMF) TaxID=293826 RepID=A6TSN5_ALKMQ|nr:hypothetical protein [Alkaliphilus metalliredigens]ABR49203.1 hypothetical protein Amet_3063 [Alkaliphilus metalliredigens QYMF]